VLMFVCLFGLWGMLMSFLLHYLHVDVLFDTRVEIMSKRSAPVSVRKDYMCSEFNASNMCSCRTEHAAFPFLG